jgi:hypothetical protein
MSLEKWKISVIQQENYMYENDLSTKKGWTYRMVFCTDSLICKYIDKYDG